MTIRAFIICWFCVVYPLNINAAETTATQHQEIIQPYEAIYDLNRRGKTYGKAVRTLQPLSDGRFKFTYRTKASVFFLTDRRSETSILQYDQTRNQWLPVEYTFERTGTGKDRYYNLTFDHQTQLAKLEDNADFVHFTYPVHDKMTFQQQLQADLLNGKQTLHYPVIDQRGRLKDYTFEKAGGETLTLPYGKVNAIKLMRESADKERVTLFWLAPDLNYTLVKLIQFEDGEESFNATLKTLTFN